MMSGMKFVIALNAFVVLALCGGISSVEGKEGSRKLRKGGNNNNSSSKNESSRRREQELADAPGAKCLNFPFDRSDFIYGLDMSTAGDGSSPLCASSSQLAAQTFLASPDDTSQILDMAGKDAADIDCADIPLATLLSMVRLSVLNPAFDAIRNCLINDEAAAAFAILRMPPKGGPVTELATKDGLQELVMKHTDCDGNLDNCIIPETFRITNSLQDCQTFFFQLDSGTFRNREWTTKPINSYAGQGITKITDIDAELVAPYGDCSQIGTHPNPIVVQRVVNPWLVDGHSCHVRTYFAFKFPSLPKPGAEDLYDPDSYDDPPQAWHVDAGNVHICTQPWSQIDDNDVGDYAFTCNKPWYISSPTDLDFTKWIFPFPEHFLNTFNPELFQQMMGSITELFRQLALVFARHAVDTQSFSNPFEDAWTIVGVDVIVGREQGNIRPWLIDINTCPKKPFQYDSQHLSDEWNPYVSFMRVIGSKLSKKQGATDSDENDCQHNKLTALVHRVL